MSKASSARDDSGPFPEWQTGARIAERRQESDGTLGRTSPNRIRIANVLIRIEKWVSHVSPLSRVRESDDIFLTDGRNTHRIEIMRFLEAGVGIEPASTALQESGDSFLNKTLAPFHFRHFATFPRFYGLVLASLSNPWRKYVRHMAPRGAAQWGFGGDGGKLTGVGHVCSPESSSRANDPRGHQLSPPTATAAVG